MPWAYLGWISSVPQSWRRRLLPGADDWAQRAYGELWHLTEGANALDREAEMAGAQVPAPADPPKPATGDLDSVRNAVLNALSDAGHRIVVSMLETGEWKVEGGERCMAPSRRLFRFLGCESSRFLGLLVFAPGGVRSCWGGEGDATNAADDGRIEESNGAGPEGTSKRAPHFQQKSRFKELRVVQFWHRIICTASYFHGQPRSIS